LQGHGFLDISLGLRHIAEKGGVRVAFWSSIGLGWWKVNLSIFQGRQLEAFCLH
jgi:hypothetical protein